MRHEVKKIAKMGDELTTFFLEHQAEDIIIHVQYKEQESIISVKASPIKNMQNVLQLLQQALSTPRQNEVEEYYWELAGESDSSNELCIVGSMTDVASIDYDEILQEINLELIRNKHA